MRHIAIFPTSGLGKGESASHIQLRGKFQWTVHQVKLKAIAVVDR